MLLHPRPHSLPASQSHFPSGDHRSRDISLLPEYRTLVSPGLAFPARAKFLCLTSAFDVLFPFPSKKALKLTILRRFE